MLSSYPAAMQALPAPPASLLGWVLLVDTGQLCLWYKAYGIVDFCCLLLLLGYRSPRKETASDSALPELFAQHSFYVSTLS